MANRYLNCFVCDNGFLRRTMARIDDEENNVRREIAIERRDNFNRPPMDVTDLTRLCINCNRSIIEEIALIEQDPTCLRLNVLSQSRNCTCLICNAVNNIHRLSVEAKANIFIQMNIYVPENVKSCADHLDAKGFILPYLNLGLRFINRPYRLKGPELQTFLQGLREVARSIKRIEDENSFTDEDFKCFCSLTKQQFQDLYTFCDRVAVEGGFRYVSKRDLLLFLCKMRQGLSDEFLNAIFQNSSRQNTSLTVDTVRRSLMLRFVPGNIGFDAIDRETYIERHVTEFANYLYNPEPETARVIACIDATYSFIDKSSNFRSLRQSYSTHKGRHLIKPVLIVAPDGYILDIQGPYFSDYYNNDAAILEADFERDGERMRRWFQENDIVLIDRGYRDSTELLAHLGIVYKMPSLLERRMRQLPTEYANNSRIITKSRWIVESRNGHIKSIFKFLKQTIPIQHVPNIGDYYRIAGALINRYHPTIQMDGADVELANHILEKAREPNVVQALVEIENLFGRNIHRWVRLDAGQLIEFPHLTLEHLRDLTLGVYQVSLAPSYIQDKLQRDPDEEFQLEMLRGENNLPERGLLRVRIYSRFRNATKHQLCIAFRPNDEIVVNDEDNEINRNDDPIFGYYCTCPSGARTVGTCAHIASVLWFLGYASYEANIHYPSTRLLDTIQDARNRFQ